MTVLASCTTGADHPKLATTKTGYYGVNGCLPLNVVQSDSINRPDNIVGVVRFRLPAEQSPNVSLTGVRGVSVGVRPDDRSILAVRLDSELSVITAAFITAVHCHLSDLLENRPVPSLKRHGALCGRRIGRTTSGVTWKRNSSRVGSPRYFEVGIPESLVQPEHLLDRRVDVGVGRNHSLSGDPTINTLSSESVLGRVAGHVNRCEDFLE